mgnify:CR=1 FL=1
MTFQAKGRAALFAAAEAQYGPLVGLESVEQTSPTGANIALRFESGIAWGVFNLSGKPPHRVAGILVNHVGPADDTPEKLLVDIQALPGATSILIARLDGGDPVLFLYVQRLLRTPTSAGWLANIRSPEG